MYLYWKTNGYFGDDYFTAKLSCPNYLGQVILAGYSEQGNKENYYDNYMAFSYHNLTVQNITQAFVNNGISVKGVIQRQYGIIQKKQ